MGERGASRRERGASERGASERGASERGASERGASERGAKRAGSEASGERASGERASGERASGERANASRASGERVNASGSERERERASERELVASGREQACVSLGCERAALAPLVWEEVAASRWLLRDGGDSAVDEGWVARRIRDDVASATFRRWLGGEAAARGWR